MEIELKDISCEADTYQVKAELARILHSESFRHAMKDQVEEEDAEDHVKEIHRLMNFKIVLEESTHGWRHRGCGMLILPSRSAGQRLLQLARQGLDFPSVESRRIRMRDSGLRPGRAMKETLRKVPYQDPSIDREREEILQKLDVSWRIDKLQFGLWLVRPEKQCGQNYSIFAVEWEKDYTAIGNARLEFDYDHKFLIFQLGDPSLDSVSHRVIIKFSSIRKMWSGFEFRPYISFDLFRPPIFETERFNRTMTGLPFEDTNKFRQRVVALDEHHRRIEAYAHQIRLTLYQEKDLEEFNRSCVIAGLQMPVMAKVVSERHDFFSQKMLLKVRKDLDAFRDLPWTVAFQVESLLRNGLLTTVQILDGLVPELKKLAKCHPSLLGSSLRDYVRELHGGFHDFPGPNDVGRNFSSFWESRHKFDPLELVAEEGDGLIACHHVTFTPTRMLLEGPYVIQSNRILRRYSMFHEHFLRVDFRDEDRLQFRWDREVDGTTLLSQVVGETLKNGFDLAGRHFDFLAYSNAALREHAVWFVSSFVHPEQGLVTAESIRRDIGDFSRDLSTPAKFAARLSLAFSATHPSVTIKRCQWKTIPDLGTDPYLHTEGVGTISPELGRRIWLSLCKNDPKLLKRIEPWAYQIRFLGHKGVVAVDQRLEGVQMCLRPSMSKFKAHEADVADIEIAKPFYAPGRFYLNRPLVMLLENLGVEKDAFIELLEDAMRNARLAYDSIARLLTLMKSHGLGSAFGLCALLQKLSSYGLDMNSTNPVKNLRSPFMDKLINCVVSSVLRDIQYRCRIPVPKSYTLVGVADEGPAYIERGAFSKDEVYTLQEGEIFACVQEDSDSEPIYLHRTCQISRSPSLYPGDVQRAFAVGKPPDDKFCAFRHLVNVVVFPSRGERSFASALSGGDLDGDTFDICQHHPLFGTRREKPAEFPPVPKWEIDLAGLEEVDPETGETKVEQEKVIPYVCDFIEKYINSDVLGMLSTKHLIRADQSSEGVNDIGCLALAKLCNEALDYPKNGMAVEVSNIPRNLIPFKPDWTMGEGDSDRRTDFYRSVRVIDEKPVTLTISKGEIFRRTEGLAARPDPAERLPSRYFTISEHPVYNALESSVKAQLQDTDIPQTTEERVRKVFQRYSEELNYICTTHTLTDNRGTRLKEEEIVVGTILAQCSVHRWRNDRIYRMRLHASNLEKEIRQQFIPRKLQEMPMNEAKESLEFAWTSWKLITDKLSTPEAENNSFGLNSFSFIALNAVIESLEYLEGSGRWR